ncbi:MAG: RICIN domain-containing protein, partial [Mucilaginibacter sp.]
MLYLILQSCSKKEIIDKPVDVMPGGKEKKSNWVPGDIVINGGYKLINLLSFKCIEMSGNGAVSPGQAQQGEYGEKAWQQWAIFNLGGGDYQIINTQSMKALAPPAGNDSEGAVLGQYTYDGTDRMKWKIIPTAGELYQIVNKGNNLNVTLENGGTADGTLITQRTYNSTSGLAILLRQLWSVQSNAGTAYCVSFSSGNDINTGLSSTVPWKTLAKVSSRKYFPGDWILLKSGDTWNNDSLVLKGNGLATRPIILNQYGSAAKPAIRPLANNRACVQLNGNAGWNISNLDLSGAKDGIRAEYDMVYGKNYLFISDCNFHDMNSTYNTKPFVYNHFSTGITINAFTFYGLGRMTFLTNFTVQNCTFTNCNAAMWTIGAPWKYCNADGFAADPHDLPVIDGVTIKNCQATNCQQMGLSAVSMKNGVVTN